MRKKGNLKMAKDWKELTMNGNGVVPRQIIDMIKLCPKNTSFFGLRASFFISKWAF